MTPTRVWMKNFRTYRDESWSPAQGLTTILGRNLLGDGADSNGSGKSTLLEALFVALFGPTIPWGEYLTVGGEATACEVGCEFDHAGESYRVRRTYDAKGRGKTTTDLERASVDGWKPLSMNRQDETQAALNRLIGLSEATYAHSVHAPQGHRHFADPTLPPRERKDILADALGLERWEQLKALVGADVRELDVALAGIAQRLGAFEDDLAQKPGLEAAHGIFVATAAQAARELTEAEEAEKTARARHDEARAAADRIAALTARRDTAKGALARLEEKQQAAAQAGERTEAERAAIERLTPLATQVESLEAESRRIATADLELAGVLDRRAALVKQIDSLTDRVETIAAEADAETGRAQFLRERGAEKTCPTCEQALHGAALAKAKASVERDGGVHDAKAVYLADQARTLTAEANLLRGEYEAIVVPAEVAASEVASAQKRLAEAREAQTEITRRTVTLESLQATAPPDPAELDAARDALTEAETLLGEAPSADAEVLGLAAREAERASTTVVTCRAADREAQTELATSTERLRSLAALALRAQESLAERTRLVERLDVLKALERSYGRDGIPALVLETQAYPQIEETAKVVLEAMGMPFRVELVGQATTKAGTLRDTLTVVVHEPGGARSYATYSGGERTRLEVALRVGIARLIAQRSSSACGMFALDELPWLDRSGQAALVEVLRGLTEFEKVVLISHDEVLADSFDNVVTVVRDEEGSRLEVAA